MVPSTSRPCPHAAQAVACAVLLVLLRRRCTPQLVGSTAAVRASLGYLRSTGLLALRTLAVMGVFALATSLAARTDPIQAAAHQITFQVRLRLRACMCVDWPAGSRV